jgi:hypothetical protein
MTNRPVLQSALLLVCGAVIGAWLITQSKDLFTAQLEPQSVDPSSVDLETVEAEVARLKMLVPSSSHIMMDAQWHWTNLWFAGRPRIGRSPNTNSMKRAVTYSG